LGNVMLAHHRLRHRRAAANRPRLPGHLTRYWRHQHAGSTAHRTCRTDILDARMPWSFMYSRARELSAPLGMLIGITEFSRRGSSIPATGEASTARYRNYDCRRSFGGVLGQLATSLLGSLHLARDIQ
jgi:hypothetical protein